MMKNNTLFENYTPKQLLEICSELEDQEKYEEVVNMLENITDYVSKENENDDDVISLILTLAWSYNILGCMTEEHIYFEKNIKLLNYFQTLLKNSDEFIWHLLMGKAYYNLDSLDEALLHLEAGFQLRPYDVNCNFNLAEVYRLLDQEPKALEHYQRLLELNEDDEMSELIDDEMNEVIIEHIKLCLSELSQPHFQECFKQRVERTWKLFEEEEEKIRQILDEIETIVNAGETAPVLFNKLLSMAQNIFVTTLQVPYFECRSRAKDEKYHLYLSTDNIFFQTHIYSYFISKMPESLKKYWSVEIGLPKKENPKIQLQDMVLDGSEFSIWLEEQEKQLIVSVFSEQLVPIIEENERYAYDLMLKLMMQALGEVAVLRLKKMDKVRFTLLHQPPKTKSSILSNLLARGKKSSESQAITLSELKETLEQKGYEVSNDVEDYLQFTYYYENEPEEMGDGWQFRDDIKYCMSRMPEIECAYNDNDFSVFDALYNMGIVAGFLSLPTESFMKDDMVSGEQLEELIDKLLAYIEENVGSDVITIIGRSMGIYCMYIDFIAWDINAVLETAHNFFKETEFDWVNYHSYHPSVDSIRLYKK